MTQEGSKPKIIFTTLENLVRSSTFSKAKTQQTELQNIKNNVLIHDNFETKNLVKQHASRHGLKSKDKITDKILGRSKSKQTSERSISNFISKNKFESEKRYFDEIQKVYLDLEVELHRSKKQFFKNYMNNNQNQQKQEQDFKRLMHKSAKIKQILLQAKQQDQPSGRDNFYELKTLSSNELENIDYLSRAYRKNQNDLRLKKGEGSKKMTVYEQVLKKKF